MKKITESAFRKAVLPLAGAAVAVGAFFGLPAMKAWAASQEAKIAPLQTIRPPIARVPVARMNIVQPGRVHQSARALVAIAGQALSDDALAERIFAEPDAVAAQHNLSDHEKLVLRHMTREQFDLARTDAARVSADRLAAAGPGRLPPHATDALQIAGGMVVGRSILAAVGRSYLDAANAHACCPWGHAIQLGVNPSRVFYNEVFEAPRADLPQLDINIPRVN